MQLMSPSMRTGSHAADVCERVIQWVSPSMRTGSHAADVSVSFEQAVMQLMFANE
jgi:hypothetical protein